MKRFSIFLAIIMVIVASSAAYAQWNKTIVDSSNVGWGVRIKLDHNGLPGISYFNNSGWVNGKVNLARYNGSSWTVESSINTGSCEGGGGAALAFDNNSQPRLVFSDYPCSHSYAEKNGSSWSFQTFSCLPDCSWSDILVDSSNNSHIAWYTSSTLEYRVWNGSTWQAQTIDSSGDVGYAPQMVMDSSGHVYISYGQWVNGSPHLLKFAYFDGTVWSTEVVANTSNAGQQHSIALTSQGYPTILYSDANGNYNLATKVSGSWQFKSTPMTTYGGGMGFAIDANDNIHIVCYQQINGTWQLIYYFYDGTTWTSSVIDQFTTTSLSYSAADLAVGSDGTVHIAYANPDTWSVIYAVQVPVIPPSISNIYGESIWNYHNCWSNVNSPGTYIGYAQVPYWDSAPHDWRDNSGIGKIIVQGSNLDKITSVTIQNGNYFVNGFQIISASQLKLDIRASYVGEPNPMPISNYNLVFTYNGGTLTKSGVSLIPTFYVNNQSWGQCTWYAGLVKRILNGQSEVRSYKNTFNKLSGDPNNPGFPKNGSVLMATSGLKKHMAYLENISLSNTVQNKDGSTTYTYNLSGTQYNATCNVGKSSFSTIMVVNKSKKGIYSIQKAPVAVYTVTGVKQ